MKGLLIYFSPSKSDHANKLWFRLGKDCGLLHLLIKESFPLLQICDEVFKSLAHKADVLHTDASP